ncbi:MAG: hypothetical protein ACODAE_08075 [Gemmatimonadota bacterium]
MALAAGLLLPGLGCFGAPADDSGPRTAYFIGIDVSGSFARGERYDDAVAFTARYIHAHMNGYGDLERPRALFVGTIGGDSPAQTQGFHPIHDFQGKGVEEIEADLREWFRREDMLTDFNTFFERVSTLAKRRNLVLAPINILVLSDGIPDLGTVDLAGERPDDPYSIIDLDPLEYLARNVTVRLLYPDPDVAASWETRIERSRVRLWTVDRVVMAGWRDQLQAPGENVVATAAATEEPASTAGGGDDEDGGEPAGSDSPAVAGGSDAAAPTGPDYQPDLWHWIADNVDFRVRRGVL